MWDLKACFFNIQVLLTQNPLQPKKTSSRTDSAIMLVHGCESPAVRFALTAPRCTNPGCLFPSTVVASSLSRDYSHSYQKPTHRLKLEVQLQASN